MAGCERSQERLHRGYRNMDHRPIDTVTLLQGTVKGEG